MKKKTFFAIFALDVAALSGCWYYSPHPPMQSMQQAAEDGDADRFNEFVDYPALRESLKGQMTAAIAPEHDKLKNHSFGVLRATLGLALINQMVDAFSGIRAREYPCMRAQEVERTILRPGYGSTSYSRRSVCLNTVWLGSAMSTGATPFFQ